MNYNCFTDPSFPQTARKFGSRLRIRRAYGKTMKGIHRLFIICLCFYLAGCQTTVQTAQTECCAVPPRPFANSSADTVLSDREIIDKAEKTVVRVESSWRLVDAATKKPVYHLYLPTKTVVSAGVKISSPAKAVPVYVKTTGGGYEPLLTADAGLYNQIVSGNVSGGGTVVSSAGFVITTGRVAAGWKANGVFAVAAPLGITMSEDLKQVERVDTPPPFDWIPENTTPRRGTAEIFNVSVKSGAKYTGVNDQLNVYLFDEDKKSEAELINTSDRSETALIKINLPDTLKKVEIYDNFDSLKKGEYLFLVYRYESTELQQSKLAVLPISCNEILRSTGNRSSQILMSDDLDDWTSISKEQENALRKGFAASAYSGAPIFDSRGAVVGTYLQYKSETRQHYVVPVRYAQNLLGDGL